MKNSGRTPNQTGQNAENIIDCVMQILRNKGYGVVSQYCLSELLTEPLTSDTIRVDFLVTGIEGVETGLIISSKRQDSPGTAQEKIPYAVYLIYEVYPYPTILMMTGNAWHSNLIRFVKRSIDGKKFINAFFTYEELLQWTESLPKIRQENVLKSIKNLPLFEELT